jgi:hypothetical protein
MGATTVGQHHFRFLDLPAELRCRVYRNIDFPTTSHVLVKTKVQVDHSRVTLIKPQPPFEILMTCHLVKEEALLILKRKMGHCRTQPV